jgi:hypothetical protein
MHPGIGKPGGRWLTRIGATVTVMVVINITSWAVDVINTRIAQYGGHTSPERKI